MTQPTTQYFAVHRFNQDYVNTLEGRPSLMNWRKVLPLIITVLICVLIFAGLFIISILSGGGRQSITLPRNFFVNLAIPIGLIVFVVVSFFVSLYRAWRLEKDGEILDGEIVDAVIQFDGRGLQYRLYIAYTFTSPFGGTVTGRTNAMRNDLARQPPPPDGTPIKVLYKNDHYHNAV